MFDVTGEGTDDGLALDPFRTITKMKAVLKPELQESEHPEKEGSDRLDKQTARS